MAAAPVQIRDQCPESSLPRVRGTDRLTWADLQVELAAGGRFVVFEYVISLVILTLRRPTDVYFVRSGKSPFVPGLPYTLLSLLLGWWGLPWGIIYTPLALFTNLSGGCDVTTAVVARLQQTGAEPPPTVPFDKIWESLAS
jgi:hypothetical protein